MRFAPYVLAGLSATAAGVQAVADPPGYGDYPDYGKKPDYPDYGKKPDYPDYGKKPDYPDYGKKPDYPDYGKKPDYPDYGKKPDYPDYKKPDYPDYKKPDYKKPDYDYGKKPDYPDYHDKPHYKKPDYHHGHGHAKVVNFCPYDVYLWSVAWDTDGPYKIGYRQEYVEKYLRGGVSLQVVKDKHSWYKDYEKLILYYKKKDKKVYYDLYSKYGDPFHGHKVVLKPEEDYCAAEYWPDGYEKDDGGKKTCDDFADLVLYLCAEYKDKDYHKKPRPYPPKYPKYPKYPDPPKYPEYPKYPELPPYPVNPPVPPAPAPVPPPVVPAPPVVPEPHVAPVPPVVPAPDLPVPIPDLPVPIPDLPVPIPDLPVPIKPPVPIPDLPVPVPDLPVPIKPPRRSRKVKRSGEGEDGQDWHARQWENDKPSWDTDPKCTDCGEKQEGVVVDITTDPEIMSETDIIPDE